MCCFINSSPNSASSSKEKDESDDDKCYNNLLEKSLNITSKSVQGYYF